MKRSSGILMPIFSLPGELGIGDFGKEAYEFVKILRDFGQKYWQVLPLNSTETSHNSPYSPLSSFAGNPLFISISLLNNDYKLNINVESKNTNHIDYNNVIKIKYFYLEKFYKSFKKDEEYFKFLDENMYWIYDYALFISLRKYLNKPLQLWPLDLKLKKKETISYYKEKLKSQIDFEIFLQFIFYKQWNELKRYANKNGIKIIGDKPIYVNHDSADVWFYPKYFKLDENLIPLYVSGAPPDIFNKHGQIWGHPVYNWENIEKDNFEYFIKIFKHYKKLYDMIRIDHFIGYSSYWEIPYKELNAKKGRWVKASGKKLFEKLLEFYDKDEIIVEDVGPVRKDVIDLRNYFGFPSMKILQFAFDGDPYNEYKPHNYTNNNCVIYTGTHDNNTSIGWFEDASEKIRDDLRRYACYEKCNEKINWVLIKLAMSSICKLSIIPIQDVLGLGKDARINTPGTKGNNWNWKLSSNYYNKNAFKKLLEYTEIFGRL